MLSSPRRGKRTKRIPKDYTRTSNTSTSIDFQASLSAEVIANNNDLLIQILVCLPIKALLKFKCVSKHWLSIISNPDFSHQVDIKSKSISGLFLRPYSSGLSNPNYEFISFDSNHSRPPFRSLTFADDPSIIRILHSCNGLLLCCCSCTNQPKPNYYIYNPTTKQHTVLPPFRSSFTTVSGIYLAFDPSRSPHYKVVCVRSSNDATNPYQVEIYSSMSGPWRRSGAPFDASLHIQFGHAVFWNGALHWLSDWGDSLAFDVNEEQLRVTPMPPIPEGWDLRMFRYFGESRGHLHLVEVYGRQAVQFSVYEMERDSSGWFPKYQVDLNPLAAAYPEMLRDSWGFLIQCVVREETDEDSYLVLHIPNKFIRYNLNDKSFKELWDVTLYRTGFEDAGFNEDTEFVEDQLQFGGFDVHHYIESLALV